LIIETWRKDVDFEYLQSRCINAECVTAKSSVGTDRCLSVVVIFDHPSCDTALDEALFSLAAQDHECLDVIVVTPDAGRYRRDQIVGLVSAQPWPIGTRARVVSVLTHSQKSISGDLVNAGLMSGHGRYVTLLGHQDLVYQHGYRVLIKRLENAAIAFGGVTISTHTYDSRHWMVAGKTQLPAARTIEYAVEGRVSVPPFVADRTRVGSEYLVVHQTTSRLAVPIFLLQLTRHPDADFELAGTRIMECRYPPNQQRASDGGPPSAYDVLKTLIEGSNIKFGTEYARQV
jgi:hypothetical protein